MKLLLFQNCLLPVTGSAEVTGIVFNFLLCWIFRLRVQLLQTGLYCFQSNYGLCLERFCVYALKSFVFYLLIFGSVFQP